MQAPEVITVVVTDSHEEARAQRRYNRWVSKKQSLNPIPATLLFIYGGMDMALSLGWNRNTDIETTPQFQYSWFIGVLAGAIVSSLFVARIPKVYFYSLGALLSVIDGIIFVSAPYEYAPIIAARYLGGIGIGLITVPFIVHSSETSDTSYRGACCAAEQYGLALGIGIQVIYESQWTLDTDFSANQLHGIFGIVLSALAMGSMSVIVESPIFYIRQNQESKARACLQRLVRELVPTELSNNAYAEAKMYVLEGSSQSLCAQLGASVMPFLKLIFFRCFVAFSFSLPLSLALELSSDVAEDYAYSWPPIVSAVLRMIGSLLTVFVLDRIGRKFISLLGLLLMGALMLTMGGIFATPAYAADSYYMGIVCGVAIAFQFFAGLYITSSTTYLGEAFPMRVKPLLIGLIVAIEQLVHIVVILTFQFTTQSLYLYFIIVGMVLVLGLCVFALLMPETRGMTLRQAGARFRRVHDVMAY